MATKEFVVASVSKNRNSFGLRGYIFVSRDGECWEASSGHKEHFEGDRVNIPILMGHVNFSWVGYEIPIRHNDCSPVLVERFWDKQPQTRGKCQNCHGTFLQTDLKDGKCPQCQNPRDLNSEVDFIIRLEGEGIEDEDDLFNGFQQLIDSHTVEHLQGSYGRAAANLIKSGHCVDTHGYFTGKKQ